MTRLIAALLVLILSACASGGGGRPIVSAPRPAAAGGGGTPEDRLRGSWNLVGLDAQGQARRATGSLAFDQFQNLTVHVELDPAEAGVTPPRTVLLDFTAKASVARANELAYLGLERRAPAERMMLSASEPGAWRYFSVEGDTLRLWQTDGDGNPVGTLTFRRQ